MDRAPADRAAADTTAADRAAEDKAASRHGRAPAHHWLARHWLTRHWLAWCFLVFALPAALFCALVTPIGQFPDEMAHIVRADGLRYGHVFGEAPPPGFQPMPITAGVPFNAGLFAIMTAPKPVGLFAPWGTPATVQHAAGAARWGTSSYWPTQMVEYFPSFYLPSALGLWLGEKTGLSPLHTLLLARVLMALSYVALGVAALLAARFGGALIFAVLTLPTALNLSASFNQDGLMSGACVLAAALLTRGRPGVSRPWYGAVLLLTLVACAKPPYAPLLLICLAPLFGPGALRRMGVVLLAAVPIALWSAHVMQAGFMPNSSAPYHPAQLWPGPRDIWLTDTLPRHNLRVLAAHPWEILKLPVVSLSFFWDMTWPLIFAMVGCDHGLIWPWEYPALVTAFAIAAAGALAGRAQGWGFADGGLAAAALFAAFCAMELSLYLTFTPAGYLVVMGVQARYFLPYLPFFIFPLAWAGGLLRHVPGAARLSLAPGWCAAPAVALAAVNAFALPVFIYHLYHMPPP